MTATVISGDRGQLAGVVVPIRCCHVDHARPAARSAKRNLLGRDVAGAARAVLRFILAQPGRDSGRIVLVVEPRRAAARRPAAPGACRRARRACASRDTCPGSPRRTAAPSNTVGDGCPRRVPGQAAGSSARQHDRQVDALACSAPIDQLARQRVADDRQCPGFAIGSVGMLGTEHAIERAGDWQCGQSPWPIRSRSCHTSGPARCVGSARSGSGPMLALSVASAITLRLARNSMQSGSGSGQAGSGPATGSAQNPPAGRQGTVILVGVTAMRTTPRRQAQAADALAPSARCVPA